MNEIEKFSCVPIEKMCGEDDNETRMLLDMLSEARSYLRSFEWCRGIREEYFGIGVGEVVAVFLFRISAAPQVDEWLWVVCGDLPTAYLVTDSAHNPLMALSVYCSLMDHWIVAVCSKSDLDSVFPVSIAPTPSNASLLEKRVNFLRNQIIPRYDSERV